MSDEYRGYRALAAAVIIRAVKDAYGSIDDPASGRAKRAAIRQEAREFLRPGNEMFDVLCDGLDLDPAATSQAIKLRGRLVVSPKIGA